MSDNVTAQIVTPVLDKWIPVFTFIAGFLLTPIVDFIKNNYFKKKQRQDDALKKHFQILDARFINITIETLNNLTEFYGEISNKGQGRSVILSDKPFIINLQDGDGEIFKLHFKYKAREIESLLISLNKHNEEFKVFIHYLKNYIQEYTKIPFSNDRERPFLQPELTDYIRLTLFQSIAGSAVGHDFKNAEISFIENGNFWRLSSDRAQRYAYADCTSKEECQSIKEKLVELQNSPQLMEKFHTIDLQAKQIRNEIEKIVESLDFLCLKYKELEVLLNIEKKCPYCQAIFHPDKGVTS